MSTAEPGPVRALLRSGLLAPRPVWRTALALVALRRWGFGLAGAVQAAAARAPASVSIVDDGEQVTYRELVDRAQARAVVLRDDYGVRPGDRVGVRGRNSLALVETLVAVNHLGAEPVLLGAEVGHRAATALAQREGVGLVLHEARFAPPTGGVRGADAATERFVSFDELAARCRPGSPARRVRPPRRAAGVVTLSSGTTGEPKAARFAPASPVTALAGFLARVPLRVGDRVLLAMPISGLWGQATLHIGLALRACVVLVHRPDPAVVWDALVAHECTALVTSPYVLAGIGRLPGLRRPAGLRLVAVGGAPLYHGGGHIMDSFGDILYNVYGATECSLVSVATPAQLRVADGTVGTAVPGTRVAVLDEQGEPVPAGQRGRIAVAVRTRPWPWPARRQVRLTEDLGHVDDRGLLHVDARQDEIIICGGINVSARPTEQAIARMPGVVDVVVTGVDDDELGQRLAATVVLAAGAQVSADDVRETVRREVSSVAVPRDVVFVPELHRSETGKLLRRPTANRT